MTQYRLGGAFPALVTPLTPERELDEDDLVRLVTRSLDEGARGVLVAGTTGEGALLTPGQRERLTLLARRAVDGYGDGTGRRVLAGASAQTVEALHEDVARLAAAGAELVLVLAPATYPLTPAELVELHVAVADRAPLPTLVYHIPRITGSALTPEAVRELASHPRIVGMKDSSEDVDRRAAFVKASHDHEFEVVTGHAPSLLAALEEGVVGSITAIANVRQRGVVGLHRAFEAGEHERAGQHQAALRDASTALAGVGASLPAVLKAALQLEGVVRERWCRPPLASVPPTRLDHVRTALLR